MAMTTTTSSRTKPHAFQRSVSPSSSPRPVRFLNRSGSPTRVNISNSSSPSSRPINKTKKTCMCSPTTHPGSFRCSLHKNANTNHQTASSYNTSYRLYARRSAMTNSLVRIGTVEGDLVRRALAALIRPSSHHQRRRADFQPKPSRLSVMSKPSLRL